MIAATNKRLEEEVRAGRFRDDLFYRLNVITIHLPPLRERRDDIPLLVEHFLDKNRYGPGSGPARISDPALALLLGHEWPGNVRELQNTLERAVALAQGGLILAEHIQFPALNERQFIDIAQRVRERTPMHACSTRRRASRSPNRSARPTATRARRPVAWRSRRTTCWRGRANSTSSPITSRSTYDRARRMENGAVRQGAAPDRERVAGARAATLDAFASDLQRTAANGDLSDLEALARLAERRAALAADASLRERWRFVADLVSAVTEVDLS